MEQETKRTFKTFSLAIDMVRTIGQPPFEVVWGDTGNLLEVTLTNDGVPIELHGAYVCVVFRSCIGTALQDETNGLTLGERAGEFTLRLLPESYGAGEVSADIQVYTGEDRATLITSRRFTFRCKNALLNDKTMQANGTYPPLISATHAATEAAALAIAAARNNGDMHTAIYDTDGDGIIDRAHRAAVADDAELLGGKAPAAYADADALAAETAAREDAVTALAETVAAITPATLGAARVSKWHAVTLLASSWEESIYTLTAEGITETAAAELCPAESITAEQLEALQAANIIGVGQAAGSITLKAFGDVPEADIPLTLTVRGDL